MGDRSLVPSDSFPLGLAFVLALVGACKSNPASPSLGDPGRPAPSASGPAGIVLEAGDEESAPWAIVQDSALRRFGVSVVGAVEALRLQVEWCIEPRGSCLR